MPPQCMAPHLKAGFRPDASLLVGSWVLGCDSKMSMHWLHPFQACSDIGTALFS